MVGATTTADPAGGPPGKGKGAGLLGTLKRKPALALGVAGAAALGAFLILGPGKKNAATDAGTGAQPGTIDPSLYGTPSDLAGAGFLGNTDDATAIEGQLTALQGQLALIAQQTMPKPPPRRKPKPKPRPRPRRPRTRPIRRRR